MKSLLQKIIATCNSVSELNEHLPDHLSITAKTHSNYVAYSIYVGERRVVLFNAPPSTKIISLMKETVLINDTTRQLIMDHLEQGLEKLMVQHRKENAEKMLRNFDEMEKMQGFVFDMLGEVERG